MMTENGDDVSMSNWAFGQHNQIQPVTTDTPKLYTSGSRIERPTKDMMTENGDGVSMSNWAFGQHSQIQPVTTDTPKLYMSGSSIDAWECLQKFLIDQILVQEKFEDTKGVIRNHKSRTDRHDNDQKKKKSKWQTTIYKALHRKLMIEQDEPNSKPGVNSPLIIITD